MINKEIIAQTIGYIEDYMDFVANHKEDAPTVEYMGNLESLLNFWRMYANFAETGGDSDVATIVE